MDIRTLVRVPGLVEINQNEPPTGRKYEIQVYHKGLDKHRALSGYDIRVLAARLQGQLRAWESAWEKAEQTKTRKRGIQEKTDEATLRTMEAEELLDSLSKLLHSALPRSHAIPWERFKRQFGKSAPEKPSLLATPRSPTFAEAAPEPVARSLPAEPAETDLLYQPFLTVWDKISRKSREQKVMASKKRYRAARIQWEMAVEEEGRRRDEEIAEWEKKKTAVAAENARRRVQWEEECAEVAAENNRYLKDYNTALERWRAEAEDFEAEARLEVEEMRRQYLSGHPPAVVLYLTEVLEGSAYPEFCPREFEMDYNPETRMLLVDYLLPGPECVPRTKEVTYIQKRDEFVEKTLSQTAHAALYDNLIYQIALRTIHELCDADSGEVLAAVVFNGWVRSIDPATGKEGRPCILSLQAGRDEFLGLELTNVEPKACFKALKGVAGSRLHSLAPVAPIMQMDRTDSRFVASYEVARDLDDSTNLAAMDWEDFEHLIREVFEAEFAQRGGEVKITQASRDRGVDAIAFDPDPISGGKIVIQAKRYTNTVQVAAVRDLYGTVINEGATKGILVTTSDYGADSYEFAKGKPLSLLNGSNLLHLLGKHGHKARIDLEEAKKLAADDR
jgi:restriction system protein